MSASRYRLWKASERIALNEDTIWGGGPYDGGVAYGAGWDPRCGCRVWAPPPPPPCCYYGGGGWGGGRGPYGGGWDGY